MKKFYDCPVKIFKTIKIRYHYHYISSLLNSLSSVYTFDLKIRQHFSFINTDAAKVAYFEVVKCC